MQLGEGFIINQEGIATMPDNPNTFALVNAANPALATRYLGSVDLLNGTVVPTFSVSDSSKLALVVGDPLPAIAAVPATDTSPAVDGMPERVPFALYPIQTFAEAADEVDVTIKLDGAQDIVMQIMISGTPLPPAETDALDQAGLVAAWANAPQVPITPV